jgi:hypothetical protein
MFVRNCKGGERKSCYDEAFKGTSSPETSEERIQLMSRKFLVSQLCLTLLVCMGANAQSAPKLTASQIVDKNIAARGGLQAWRSLQTMTWKGKMDVGTGDSVARSRAMSTNSMRQARAMTAASAAKAAEVKQVQLPFTSDWKRGRKSRVEIEFNGKTSVQVYDGSNGWMLRPYLNRNDYEPFNADQLKAQSQEADIDGYLVDYAAKGNKIDLEGVEKVEGKDAYKIKVTQKSGDVRYVWIDTTSFLDVRVSGAQRRMDGKMRTVYVYQRDFRAENGLMIPHTLETIVDGYHDPHNMVIESVVVNPKLADTLFTKPQ